MSLWLFRAGASGEYENKFLTDKRVYLTWEDLDVDLRSFSEKTALFNYLRIKYPHDKPGRARNWTGQIWPMAHDIQIGDWVILPSKVRPAVHIGKVIGEYVYDASLGSPYYHYRTINWFATDIPRSNFDQDILYSIGAFMTVCRISRNDAEQRIKKMAANNWKSSIANTVDPAFNNLNVENSEETAGEEIDLEQYAKDRIAKYIIRKFKGHGLTMIIEAILQAQGYTTYKSPEGVDKGVDILAAPGELGFGRPRICVQVKSSDSPIDRPTLDQLIGVMQNFNADQGLLVSWGGFKSSIDKEIPAQFFRVRLWDQQSIIDELLRYYDKLDEDIKAEIPLKRIWTLAISEEEN
ncbi:restriction system protein [Hydrogenispora ethanolica]|uniref:Restriction system protein n=1 Tax=Hydrogenispora ethanolica TaxID=1082276 RepID=A0A4R1S8Q7_HYDET|nr:restriction endonuclease [Hydrogenispora ethanolica]TCL75300.1 restriction system protein [Hydrogenispora ethanolica]